jgi:ABC-type branched-subunit amino acid transport system permease subunit
VNWTGELSLATAAGVGLPAFAVAKLAADWGATPLALLPVGVAVGAVAGVVIGLPSLRARGLQVALVTLAAGIAVERFLFTKPWLVGPPGGVAVPVPTLGPLRFETSTALYPVLALVAVAAVAGAAVLHHSKAARAMAWIRDQPEAAAAFAIPVTSYRLAAYGLTGAYAGLAGGFSATWVQRLTPGAFPFTLSFTYLVMVVLAGRGFVWGVLAAVALLEGGRVFASGVGPIVAYGGPIALVFVITRHRAGLNGTGRKLMETARRILTTEDTARTRASLTTIAGVGAVVLGLTSIALAWYHAGNTDQVWVQNQLLLSGGLVGLALVILGGLAVATERIVRALEQRE